MMKIKKDDRMKKKSKSVIFLLFVYNCMISNIV